MVEAVSLYEKDTLYLRIAREIAIDLYEIETILKNNQIDPGTFERIKVDPRFLKLLESEVLAWHSAGNTLERTKLKAGALLEEFLPEANARIHDKAETLSAKTELVKTLARIAGMGLDRAQVDGLSGERFTVTINLGADHKLQFNNTVTPKVTTIEGEVVKES